MARTRLVVLVLLGFGAGWFSARLAGTAAPEAPTYLATLAERLALRPDQVERIAQILGEEDRRLVELVAEERPVLAERVAAERSRTEADIVALLDDEQRARYEAQSDGR